MVTILDLLGFSENTDIQGKLSAALRKKPNSWEVLGKIIYIVHPPDKPQVIDDANEHTTLIRVTVGGEIAHKNITSLEDTLEKVLRESRIAGEIQIWSGALRCKSVKRAEIPVKAASVQ